MTEDIHTRVLAFIGALKGIDWAKEYPEQQFDKDDTAVHIIEEIYSRGNCGNFAVALCIAFPEAVPYYVAHLDDIQFGVSNKEIEHHVAVEIGDRLYDIKGDVTDYYEKSTQTTIEEIIQSKTHGFFSNYSFKERGPME
jgi:hypothetical protein